MDNKIMFFDFLPLCAGKYRVRFSSNLLIPWTARTIKILFLKRGNGVYDFTTQLWHTTNSGNWKNFSILCSVLLLFSSECNLTKQHQSGLLIQDALGRVRSFFIVFLKQDTPTIVWSKCRWVLLSSIKMVFCSALRSHKIASLCSAQMTTRHPFFHLKQVL